MRGKMKKTDVIVCNKLPVRLSGTPIVVIDKKLTRLPFVKLWLKKYKVIAVEAGENLKTISRFQEITEKILKESAGTSMQKICLIAVGGGSCLLYTSPSPRDKRQSRMPSSA